MDFIHIIRGQQVQQFRFDQAIIFKRVYSIGGSVIARLCDGSDEFVFDAVSDLELVMFGKEEIDAAAFAEAGITPARAREIDANSKKPRGGPGRGQGRKPIKDGQETVTVSLRLTAGQRQKLARLGGAEWVRERIDKDPS